MKPTITIKRSTGIFEMLAAAATALETLSQGYLASVMRARVRTALPRVEEAISIIGEYVDFVYED